jgi:hypothetical protein
MDRIDLVIEWRRGVGAFPLFQIVEASRVAYFFEFDEVNNVLHLAWQGQVTDEDLLEGASNGRRLLASRPGARAISDFSRATKIDVSSETVRKSAWAPDQGEGDSVVVTVAPGDFIFGMARMYQMLADMNLRNHHVVRTVREAYELLGMAAPQFARISDI